MLKKSKLKEKDFNVTRGLDNDHLRVGEILLCKTRKKKRTKIKNIFNIFKNAF